MEQLVLQAFGSSLATIWRLRLVIPVTLFLSFLFCLNTCAQDGTIVFPGLAKEISEMKAADQAARKLLGNAFENQSSKDSLNMMVGRLDSLHNIKLNSFIDKYGYPSPSMVGMRASHDFWVLTMHQDDDLAFQEKILSWLESIRKTSDVLSRNFATLHDRISVNKGNCQTYGTQVDFDTDLQKYISFPICDEKGLKKRRKKMKLMPLQRQLEQENGMR